MKRAYAAPTVIEQRVISFETKKSGKPSKGGPGPGPGRGGPGGRR